MADLNQMLKLFNQYVNQNSQSKTREKAQRFFQGLLIEDLACWQWLEVGRAFSRIDGLLALRALCQARLQAKEPADLIKIIKLIDSLIFESQSLQGLAEVMIKLCLQGAFKHTSTPGEVFELRNTICLQLPHLVPCVDKILTR
ncbi:MAG: hypothetical protein ACOCU8_00620 [Patescibacteria group bacterium]